MISLEVLLFSKKKEREMRGRGEGGTGRREMRLRG